MKAKKLVEITDTYADLLQLAGNESLASKLRRLSTALKERGGLETSFINEVLQDSVGGEPDKLEQPLAALAKLQRLSGGKKFAIEFDAMAEQAKHGSLDERIEHLDIVRHFVDKLAKAPIRLSAVQPIIKSMSAAGVLSTKDAAEIARSYVGGPGSYKNKKAALEAIRDRVARNEGLESKARMS